MQPNTSHRVFGPAEIEKLSSAYDAVLRRVSDEGVLASGLARRVPGRSLRTLIARHILSEAAAGKFDVGELAESTTALLLRTNLVELAGAEIDERRFA